MAPSLPVQPVLALSSLEELIEQSLALSLPVRLVGSSLGGFYAIYLAERYDLSAVLINPAIHPCMTLEQGVGQVSHYHDQMRYEWRADHVQSLKNYAVGVPTPHRYWLMLQTGDELLDYQEALAYLPGARVLLEEGGDHGFKGFERHLAEVLSFQPF